jgi:acetate---CoA ligase (ADP-forming) subunit beta
MTDPGKMIEEALREGRRTLSEFESKDLLRVYGIPVAREILVRPQDDFGKTFTEIGFPLVIKGCAPGPAHKTERGLVRTDIRNDQEARTAILEILSLMEEKEKAALIQEMVQGRRELMIGMTRDSQFGPCVMFGLGGIFTEILQDVVFRVAPIGKEDAFEMMGEIKANKILEAVRGMPAADREALSSILITMGEIGLAHGEIREIDINPLILSGSQPIAVDALVVLEP